MKKIILIFLVLLVSVAEAQYVQPKMSETKTVPPKNTKIEKQAIGNEFKSSGATFDVGLFLTPGMFSLGYSPLDVEKTFQNWGGNGGVDLRVKPERVKFWLGIGLSIAHFGARSIYETSIIARNLQDPIYGYNYELKSDLSNLIEKQSLLSLGIPIGLYYELNDIRLGLGVSLYTILSSKYWLASGMVATSYHDTDLDVWFGSDLGAHGVGVTEYYNESRKRLDVNNVMVSPYIDLSYVMNDFSIGIYLECDAINLYKKGEYAEADIVSISDGVMNYNGVLHSNQVMSVHPWAAGIRARYSFKNWPQKETKIVVREVHVPVPPEPEIPSRPEYVSECDTAVINLMQVLSNYELSEKQIQRVLRLYEKMPDSEYKASKRGAYTALAQYPSVYKEFQKVLKNAVSELKNKSATIVASNCKKSLEEIPYWMRREAMEYRYEYLEKEIYNIISIIDSYLDEGSKIKASQFREQFNQAVEGF